MSVTRDDVLAVLKDVADPGGGDVVSAGVVKALTVDAGIVRFVLEIAPSRADAYGPVKVDAETRVGAVPGVTSVSVVLTWNYNRHWQIQRKKLNEKIT